MSDLQLVVACMIGAAIVLTFACVIARRGGRLAAVAVVLGCVSAAALFAALLSIRANRETRRQVQVVQRNIVRAPTDAELRAALRRAIEVARPEDLRLLRRELGRGGAVTPRPSSGSSPGKRARPHTPRRRQGTSSPTVNPGRPAPAAQAPAPTTSTAAQASPQAPQAPAVTVPPVVTVPAPQVPPQAPQVTVPSVVVLPPVTVGPVTVAPCPLLPPPLERPFCR